MLFIAFIAWQAFKNIPEHKGRDGEFHVYNILAQLPEEYPVLDDVVLKTNSCTTQIDHVVVPCYRVFAIETKNYCGYIYGNDDQLLATKRSYSSTSMSDADVTSGQPLTQQNVRNQVDDRAHVSNVYAAKYNTDSKIASGICTQCGALVLRHGRYGTFYGCSNYPRCRFTKTKQLKSTPLIPSPPRSSAPRRSLCLVPGSARSLAFRYRHGSYLSVPSAPLTRPALSFPILQASSRRSTSCSSRQPHKPKLLPFAATVAHRRCQRERTPSALT